MLSLEMAILTATHISLARASHVVLQNFKRHGEVGSSKCLCGETTGIFLNSSNDSFDWITASMIVKSLILGPLINKMMHRRKFSL